jgi:hypothetical protein
MEMKRVGGGSESFGVAPVSLGVVLLSIVGLLVLGLITGGCGQPS